MAFRQFAEGRESCQVPEFLSRPLEWFRGRSNAQKVLIGAGVVIVLIAAFWMLQVMY